MGHSVLTLLTFRSKLIAAEGEHKASNAQRHAAEVVMDSPAALKVFIIIPAVKISKTLNTINAENNSTIIQGGMKYFTLWDNCWSNIME